jgi:hypothetical protein
VLPIVVAKSVYCLAVVAALTPLAFELSQPNSGVRSWWMPIALIVLLSAGTTGVLLALTPAPERLSAWMAGDLPVCLRRIPILAAPVAFALVLAARTIAPTRLTLAGAAIGAMSGGIAAIVYSWSCRVDSIAYVATWYPVAILICAALGAASGRWLLRW